MKRKYSYKPKINKICKFCGSPAPSNLQGYCQPCYKYFVMDKKKIYPLPRHGEITYNEDGDAICPECGKAFCKLGGHIRYAHHMTTADFFKKHGWHVRKTKASNIEYRKKMKDIQDPKTISVNLIEKGKSTRFFETNGNSPELFNHSAIDRCYKCKHCKKETLYCLKKSAPCKCVLHCSENDR